MLQNLGAAQKYLHILLPVLRLADHVSAGMAYCKPENQQPRGARRRTGICGVAAPRLRSDASAHPALAPECELISAQPLTFFRRRILNCYAHINPG
jgi:hypothetical protein